MSALCSWFKSNQTSSDLHVNEALINLLSTRTKKKWRENLWRIYCDVYGKNDDIYEKKRGGEMKQEKRRKKKSIN